MSTDTDDAGDDESGPVNIPLSLGESGDVWIVRDEDTGVVSQGQTRQTAFEKLDEAVAGYHGAGESPSDDDLREMGIDSQSWSHSYQWPSVTSSFSMPSAPYCEATSSTARASPSGSSSGRF